MKKAEGAAILAKSCHFADAALTGVGERSVQRVTSEPMITKLRPRSAAGPLPIAVRRRRQRTTRR